MRRVVNTSNGAYDIEIRHGFDLPNLVYKKIMIVTDSNVEKYQLESFIKSLKNDNIKVFSFKAGEESKNIDTVCEIYKKCIEYELDRKSCIIALGGGVVGDIAGFVASTYMRGIDYIQVPTSLLAMADSSIGGKTGFDFCGSKNIIGAFWQPKLVYVNCDSLDTLPYEQFCAGMAEIVKHGLIYDKVFFDFLIENKQKIKNRENDIVEKMIYDNCKTKAEVVASDEKENGVRAILNFGHTIGHAVESASNFKMLHGECVALGMICAVKISENRHNIDSSVLNKYLEFLEYFDLPLKTSFDFSKVLNNMKKDKKRENGKQKFILLSELGKAYITQDVTDEEITQALKYICEGN